MPKKNKCLTPGAVYHLEIHSKGMRFQVDLPKPLPELTEKEYQEMEDKIHDFIEKLIWETHQK